MVGGRSQLEIELVARDLAHSILQRAAQDIDRLDREADQASASTSRLSSAFGGLGGTISRLGQLGFGVFGIQQLVFGVQQALNPVIGLANAASALEEAQNRVNVVFGDGSEEILRWAENAATSLGQSETAAVQAVGTFGNLFTSLGQTGEAAATMSTRMVELAADFSSFFDVAPENALVALRAGLVGEIEPLRRFGIAINAAAVETKALELGLAATKDEIEESDKVIARYQLILEGSTNAQGDFARTADSAANQQRILSAQLADLRVELGERLLPHFTKLLITLNEEIIPNLDEAGEAVQSFVQDVHELARMLGVVTAADWIITVVFNTEDLPDWLQFGVESVGSGISLSGPRQALSNIADRQREVRARREEAEALEEIYNLLTGEAIPNLSELAHTYADVNRAAEEQANLIAEQQSVLDDLANQMGLTRGELDDWLVSISGAILETDNMASAMAVIRGELGSRLANMGPPDQLLGFQGPVPSPFAPFPGSDLNVPPHLQISHPAVLNDRQRMINQWNLDQAAAAERAGRGRSGGAGPPEPTVLSPELQALIRGIVEATPTPAFGGLSPEQFVEQWEVASAQFSAMQRELSFRLAELGLEMAELDAQGLENTDTFAAMEEQAGALQDALRRIDLIEELRLEPFRDALQDAAEAVEAATRAEEQREQRFNNLINQRAGVFGEGPAGAAVGFGSFVNQLLGINEFAEFGPDPRALDSIRRLAGSVDTTVGIPGFGHVRGTEFLEGGRFGDLTAQQIIDQIRPMVPAELKEFSKTTNEAKTAMEEFEDAIARIDLVNSLRLGDVGEEAELAAAGIDALLRSLRAAIAAARAGGWPPSPAEQGA